MNHDFISNKCMEWIFTNDVIGFSIAKGCNAFYRNIRRDALRKIVYVFFCMQLFMLGSCNQLKILWIIVVVIPVFVVYRLFLGIDIGKPMGFLRIIPEYKEKIFEMHLVLIGFID